jgi:hypothetical protein
MSNERTSSNGSYNPPSAGASDQLRCPCCGSQLALKKVNSAARFEVEAVDSIMPAEGGL